MNKIRQPLEIYKQGASAITEAFGSAIKAEIPVFIGNPSTGDIFVDNEQKLIYVHQFGSDPAGATIVSNSGIPKEKMTYGQPILIKQTPSGQYRFVGIDTQSDDIYSIGVSETNTQEPVNLSQLRWGTIHPYSGLSILLVGAFYGGTYVPDLVSESFDGTALDTSLATISPPTTNNRQIAVLLQLDISTASIEYKQSTLYSAGISPSKAYDNGLLPIADDNRYRVGYVFLKNGVTSLSYADLWVVPEIIGVHSDSSLGYPNPVLSAITISAGRTLLAEDGFEVSSGASVTIESGSRLAILQAY